MSFDRIETAARADAGRSEWLLRFAQASQTIVIPALIAAMAWFRDDIQKVGGIFYFLIIGLVILQLVLFYISQSARQSIQELYFVSKDLKEELVQATREGALYKDKTELFIRIDKFAMTCARPLLDYQGQTIRDMDGLKKIVSNILEPLVLQGEQIFGFGSSEKWNFVVYLYSSKHAVLLPVWREKAQAHPSQGMGRLWEPGQGHVGFVFANAKAVITGNATIPDVKNLVSAVDKLARDCDPTHMCHLRASRLAR
ncbi:MAG: hypothetical protein WCD69_21715 [Xanthobacteraceae bacterium]